MKLLILKPDHLGDFALALPALWETRQYVGLDARIDILAARSNGIWGEILPWLGNLIPLRHPRYQRPQPSGWKQWYMGFEAFKMVVRRRRLQYDVAVELTSRAHDSLGKWLLAASGAKLRCGPQGGSSSLLHRAWLTPVGLHQTQILAHRFPPEWGITGNTLPADFMPKELQYNSNTAEGILVSPWAGTSAKQWPIASWREFLRACQHLPLQLLVPQDVREEASKLAQGLTVAWVETSSISQTLQLLANARVAIAMDSALAHFAWLTGTPLVEIFAGTTELERWGALGEVTHLRHFPHCAPCHLEKCNQPRHFCMERISVEQLIEAVQSKYDSKN